MADKRIEREDCIKLLREKYSALTESSESGESGENRYPKRSDFSEREVVAIKAFLGPWPRALEAAGVKPPREDGKAERARDKRIRAKRRRIERLKEDKPKQDRAGNNGMTQYESKEKD